MDAADASPMLDTDELMRSNPISRRELLRYLTALAGSSLIIETLGLARARPAWAAAASPTGALRTGGTVAIPIGDDPLMNPVIGWRAGADLVNNSLYTPLTRPDPKTLLPVGYAARSWETSDDGLTWTFHLNSGIKFHDGRPLTAEDVKFTYEQILLKENGSPWRANFSEIQQMVIVDPLTIRFRLGKPVASLASLMHDRHGIVPRHLLRGKDITKAVEFNKRKPIGAGPFRFKESGGARVTLERHPNFFHKGRPFLDRIVFKVIPDLNVQLAQLKTRELSVALINAEALPSVKSDPNVVVQVVNTSGWYCVFLNNKDPWFQDKRVRQAMAYGTDRKSILAAALSNVGMLANGPYLPTSYYYNRDLRYYEYDPTKAKDLLKAAGWEDHDGDGFIDKNGERFKFTIYLESGALLQQAMGAVLQQNYRALGMDVDFQQLPFSEFIDVRFFGRNYKVMASVWFTGPDPDIFNWFHSSTAEQGFNVQGYKNPEVDKLLEEGRRYSDRAKRREIYNKLQNVLMDEVPVIFLFHPVQIRAWDARLINYTSIDLRVDMLWSEQMRFKS